MAAYAMTELDDKKDGEGGNNKKAADTAADGNTAPEKENATEAKDDSNSTVHGFGSSPSKASETDPTTDAAVPTPKDSNDPPLPSPKNNNVAVEKETEVVSIEQKSSAEVTPNNNDRKRSHSTMEEPPSSFNPPPRQNDLFRNNNNNNKANVSILPERNVSSDSGDHNVEHRAKKIAVEKI
jgi:hypothetical protein